MIEPRWPDDIPPPHADLYRLGQRCLDEVNDTAQQHPPVTPLEHQLLEIGRTQSLAIGKLAKELLTLRGEFEAYDAANALISAPPATSLVTIARTLVTRHRNASVSWLQRTLRISYSRATDLMETLEAQGIVSSADNLGRRRLLVFT